jgi:hypothetical protein
LCLLVGEYHIGFAVADKSAGELPSLGYYEAPEVSSDTLAAVFSQHDELRMAYPDVQISYDYPKNVLVPSQHFYVDASRIMINTLHGTGGESPVFWEFVKEWQLYNVYLLPRDVHDWVSKRFQVITGRHHFTLKLKAMPAGPADRILVDVSTKDFSLIATRDHKLLVAQTHLYESPEDISYCLLKTCHQYSLSQENVEISVSGLVEKDSQLYKEICQFFVHVGFRQSSWTFEGESAEYPAHFFTTLNDLARCAS